MKEKDWEFRVGLGWIGMGWGVKSDAMQLQTQALGELVLRKSGMGAAIVRRRS
jgi:hypothetical protein